MDRFILCFDPLGIQHFLQPVLNDLRRDPPKVISLTSGQYRGKKSLGICGCQNKDRIFRGLLQSLQKCVERFAGQHMDFIDDVDLVASFGGRVRDLGDDLTEIVDASLGRSVHLNHIHGGAGLYRPARRAFRTRIAVHGILAVDRLRHDLGARSLTCSAASAEQICMSDPSGPDLIAESPDDNFLTLHIVEDLRAVFTIQRLIIHPVPAFLQIK